jgi:hypothetical protein
MSGCSPSVGMSSWGHLLAGQPVGIKSGSPYPKAEAANTASTPGQNRRHPRHGRLRPSGWCQPPVCAIEAQPASAHRYWQSRQRQGLSLSQDAIQPSEVESDVLDGGCSGSSFDGLAAVVRGGAAGVGLAGGDDLTIGGLQPEPVLAIAALEHPNFAAISVPLMQR